jgi:hypothetical protein
MPWASGDNLSPTNLNNKSGTVYNVKDAAYGAIGDGSTNDTAAIQAALNASSRGDVVWLPATANGYSISTQVIVPSGVILQGGRQEMNLSRFADNGSLNSASVPGGTFLKITSTVTSPVVLRSNAAIKGITFWYPNQTWAVSRATESFVAYPTAIQLGDAIDPGPYHPAIHHCQFLGATRCITQYATDGTSLKGVDIAGCTGVLLGDFLRVARATEVLHVRNCHFTPNAVTAFVGDSDVGGNVAAFRTASALTSRVFHLGNVDDIEVVDVFAFGATNFVRWSDVFYAGDTGEGLSGTFTNCACDGCYQAFVSERYGSVAPVNVQGGWFAPTLRPNAVASDSASQALFYTASGVSQIRANFANLRVYGTTDSSFSAGYSGQINHAFTGAGVHGSGTNINVGNCHFSVTSSVVHNTFKNTVHLGHHTLNDVPQAVQVQAFSVLSAVAALPSAASNQGYFYADSGSSLYWVNGSGVSTLVA